MDGSVRPRGERFACATDPDSLATLAEELRPLEAQLIVLEASGGYEAPVAAALAAVGLPVAIVNPRPVRQFAGAIGRLAKPVLGPAIDRARGTDAIDAAVPPFRRGGPTRAAAPAPRTRPPGGATGTTPSSIAAPPSSAAPPEPPRSPSPSRAR